MSIIQGINSRRPVGDVAVVDNPDPFGDSSGVALYQLNGDATDESGNYNGTASNVTYSTGVFGSCGVFNGISSYVTNATNLMNTIFSVGLWAKGDDTSRIIAISNSNSGANASVNYFGFVGGKIEVNLGNGSTNQKDNTSISTSFSSTTFKHYVLTVDGSNIKVYEDSSLIGTIPQTVAATTGTAFYMGAWGSSFSFFDGSIDQVRIFNKALDSTEVTQIYNEVI